MYSSSVHYQEFFTVHTAMVYVIQVCWQLVRRIRMECSQAVWHIPLLCVQWKTTDNGQRNCPKHVEFYSKNKFEKLVHLIGFIIRIVKYLSVFVCWLAYMYVCHFSLNSIPVCCDFLTCRPCALFIYYTKSITYSISFLSSSCFFFCTSSFFLSTLSSFCHPPPPKPSSSSCIILTYSDHLNFADSWFATTPFPLPWVESFIYEWEWCPEPSASNCISNKSTASGFEPEWFVIETCCIFSFILVYLCTYSRAL